MSKKKLNKLSVWTTVEILNEVDFFVKYLALKKEGGNVILQNPIPLAEKKWVSVDSILDEIKECQKEKRSADDILYNLMVKINLKEENENEKRRNTKNRN